jgi:hypothetical protein
MSEQGHWPGLLIRNTQEPIRCAWPAGTFIQGGARGVVFGGQRGSYRTAFVEVILGGTFLRGEGPSIEAAEMRCWEKYEQMNSCSTAPDHGPWDRRGYRNGSAFCISCGSWFPDNMTGLAELPDIEGAGDQSAIGRLFRGDRDALIEVIQTVTHVDDLPEKEHDR